MRDQKKNRKWAKWASFEVQSMATNPLRLNIR
jgi:hypothetical protein